MNDTVHDLAADQLDELCVNTLRFLAVDAVQKASSGHPGMPMGSAPMAYVLWDRFLKFNPKDPGFIDRDRFILSCGHGSMLLYALLHVTGFDLSLDEIKRFRQWGSKTPGHPEYGVTPGVEVSTGPLGQGFANAVGMAIAESHLAARFNRPGHKIVDHYTYVIASDGDLMEGISSEAASLAGHLRLGKLVVLYADNRVTLSGPTSVTFTEDVGARFAAYGWHTEHVSSGTDLAALQLALDAAKAVSDRPSLICVRTHIGYGSPHKHDSYKSHGSPLGEEEVALTKQHLHWPETPSFLIPDAVASHFRMAIDRGQHIQDQWNSRFSSYAEAFPELAKQFERVNAGKLPDNWYSGLPAFEPEQGPMATRDASSAAINALAINIPELFGGSGDLDPSTRAAIKDGGNFEQSSRAGRNIQYGVREHAMGGVLSGLAAHGGLIPYGASFLIFSDYMRPPIRLAAMGGLGVIYVFTHDSIAIGEDGPSHQPVEQLLGLRSIPGLVVLRPADANETVAAWRYAIAHRDRPVALVLTRQKLPVLDPNRHHGLFQRVSSGGYILEDPTGGAAPDLIMIATGSEVHLALEAQKQLAIEGLRSRVVSLPSCELFAEQPQTYREHVLPAGVPMLAIEAGVSLGWHSYVGPQAIETVCVDRFGASAPGEVVMKEYGMSVEHILERAHTICKSKDRRTR